MTEQEEAVQWLNRIAGGDPSAVSELYGAFGRRLYGFALRLTGNPALAEDIAQDTLVTVWRTARSFRGEGRVLSWLLGIVHHKAVKANRRRHEPVTAQMKESIVSPEASPEENARAGEYAARVRQGLQCLSNKHRVALELVFFHGLSLEEAARVCRCPVGTIKSRLSHAKSSLREAMARAGLGPEEEG